MGRALTALDAVGRVLHHTDQGLSRAATYTPAGGSPVAISVVLSEETDELVLAEIDSSVLRTARARVIAGDVADPRDEATITAMAAPWGGTWTVHRVRRLPQGDAWLTIVQPTETATVHPAHGAGRGDA